jgi:hypothetical protein
MTTDDLLSALVRRSPKAGDKLTSGNITKPSTPKVTRKQKTEKRDTREIWAADSETDPFLAGRVPRPFIWGAFNGAQFWSFRTTREFVDFIKERECIVYAHNGGKFDWHFLLDELTPFQPLMVINGRLAKFAIGKAEFRDSFNIMPMPLAAVQKTEIDYNKFEADVREQHMGEIREYLRDDCVYLHGMLTAFIEEFGLHLTQAGASVKAWERIADVKAPVTSAAFYAELAPFYYGGRVQCFHAGEYRDAFKIIDINSAYPFAMMREHPSGDTITSIPFLPATDDEISRTFITMTADALGAFPCRADDGSLFFPDDGNVRTFHITGWEYLAARDTGALRNVAVHEVKTFAERIEFSAYLNHFYAMKTNSKRAGYDEREGRWHDLGQKARYEFSKRFLNSLYGKMGANPEHYEEFTVVKPQHVDAAEAEDGYGFVCELGKLCLVSKPLPEDRQRFYNVAIAASITGFVRAYLWRAISTCRNAGGAVLYCDTDCLWATETGDLRLHPEDLGAWDVEAECDYGAIAGKKMYAARTIKAAKRGDDESDADFAERCPDGRAWKTASKGVRLSVSQLVHVAQGKEIRYSPENPTFSLKRGVSFTPRTIRRTRTGTPTNGEFDNGHRNPHEDPGEDQHDEDC